MANILQNLMSSWPLEGSTADARDALRRWRTVHPGLPPADTPVELVRAALASESHAANQVLRVLLVEAGTADPVARRAALALVSPALAAQITRALTRASLSVERRAEFVDADDIVATLVARAWAILGDLAAEYANDDRDHQRGVGEWPLTRFWSRLDKSARRHLVRAPSFEMRLVNERPLDPDLHDRPAHDDPTPAVELLHLLVGAVRNHAVTAEQATVVARRALLDDELADVGALVGIGPRQVQRRYIGAVSQLRNDAHNDRDEPGPDQISNPAPRRARSRSSARAVASAAAARRRRDAAQVAAWRAARAQHPAGSGGVHHATVGKGA